MDFFFIFGIRLSNSITKQHSKFQVEFDLTEYRSERTNASMQLLRDVLPLPNTMTQMYSGSTEGRNEPAYY